MENFFESLKSFYSAHKGWIIFWAVWILAFIIVLVLAFDKLSELGKYFN